MMDMPPGYSAKKPKEPAEIQRHFPITQTYEEFYGITESAFSMPPGFENRKAEVKPKPVDNPVIPAEEVKAHAPVHEVPAKVKKGKDKKK